MWDDVRAADTVKKFPNENYKRFSQDAGKRKNDWCCFCFPPDHTIHMAAMAAMQLGKHVYVQNC